MVYIFIENFLQQKKHLFQEPDDPKPIYDFEVTTNFFHIDEDGFLVVGQENLDRDPPSPGKFRFQVKLIRT